MSSQSILLSILLLIPSFTFCQTDYDDLTNWSFHPEQNVNLLALYNLDIAVINKNLGTDSIISISNKAKINTGIDVFFVHPTQLTGTYLTPSTVAINDQNAQMIQLTILAQGGLLAKYGRFYAPRYRQSTPPAYAPLSSESSRADAIKTSYSDIKAAFLHYLENHNNGNKFILAGHSQGSFLLGLLLRDVIDKDPSLRNRMVSAALGGMNYAYTAKNETTGGWWENIPFCTTTDQCGCIQNWTTFRSEQSFPSFNSALPAFNQELVDEGLVYQKLDTAIHTLHQDTGFYGLSKTKLRYYISPDASYKLNDNVSIIAFDGLYDIQHDKTENYGIGLKLTHTPESGDQRPNDLASQESLSNFDRLGYHNKDYHIYLWALMKQLDQKVSCSATSWVNEPDTEKFSLYPNPSSQYIAIKFQKAHGNLQDTLLVYNLQGKLLFSKSARNSVLDISELSSGAYYVQYRNQRVRFIKY